MLHFAFGKWRAERLPFLGADTATQFIRVYEKFGKDVDVRNNFIQYNFSPTLLYLLAAPSTPESVVADITARVESSANAGMDAVFRRVSSLRTDGSQVLVGWLAVRSEIISHRLCPASPSLVVIVVRGLICLSRFCSWRRACKPLSTMPALGCFAGRLWCPAASYAGNEVRGCGASCGACNGLVYRT